MQNEIAKEVNLLLKEYNTLSIATIDQENQPNVSYSPYVIIDNSIYIIISEIAKHYKNIINQNKIQVAITQDEFQAMSIFFRKRLTINVHVGITQNVEAVTDVMIQKLGKMVEMLMKMDFHIIKLEILDAKIVYGPGKAYFLDHNFDLIEHDTAENNGHYANHH